MCLMNNRETLISVVAMMTNIHDKYNNNIQSSNTIPILNHCLDQYIYPYLLSMICFTVIIVVGMTEIR